MSMPLEGVRVLDLTVYAFGPRTSEYLAEMGAEVIKIENTETGEPIRWIDSMREVPVGKFKAYFEQTHRGKKSMAMDLHHEAAREAVYKLAEKSDVFVTNLRVGGLRRLGMDYDTLSKINPRLVYAIGTGWGLKGPARDRGAFEATGFAASALVTSLAEPGSRPPLCPPAFGDYTAATLLAYGIMLALFHRERTGEGQMVHASLLGTSMKVISCCIDTCLVAGRDMFGQAHELDGAFYSMYQTKDGRWIQLSVVQDYRSWTEFCQAVGLQGMGDDPRFNSPEARRENNAALIAILDEIFLGKTQSEWIDVLDKYNFPWAPVRHFTELANDPQVLENEYLVTIEDPEAGKVQVVGPALDLSKTPGKVGDKAPELGQHTEEILLELGYAWEEIMAMKEKGAIL